MIVCTDEMMHVLQPDMMDLLHIDAHTLVAIDAGLLRVVAQHYLSYCLGRRPMRKECHARKMSQPEPPSTTEASDPFCNAHKGAPQPAGIPGSSTVQADTTGNQGLVRASGFTPMECNNTSLEFDAHQDAGQRNGLQTQMTIVEEMHISPCQRRAGDVQAECQRLGTAQVDCKVPGACKRLRFT